MPTGNQLFQLTIATPDGQFIARYSEKGLAELDFPDARAFVAPKRSEGGPVGRASSPAVSSRRRGNESPISPPNGSGRDSSRRLLQIPDEIREWHRATESALRNVLAGTEPKDFPPLDAAGTAFQKSVWREMRKIPFGRTKSYGEVAQAIGKPKAVRAVGGACGANPIPVLVPCHRVLAAHGKIGGFGGGLEWKRKLLTREGVEH